MNVLHLSNPNADPPELRVVVIIPTIELLAQYFLKVFPYRYSPTDRLAKQQVRATPQSKRDCATILQSSLSSFYVSNASVITLSSLAVMHVHSEEYV